MTSNLCVANLAIRSYSFQPVQLSFRRVSLLGIERLLLGLIHFEDGKQVRELEHVARPFTQSEQNEAVFESLRFLETLHQGSDAGTVNIFYLLQIHDHSRSPL